MADHNTPADNRLTELASGYVLGILTPEELGEVEERLSGGDTALAEEIRVMGEVTGLIPLGLPPRPPRSEVKARLMWRVAMESKPLDIDDPIERDGTQYNNLRQALERAAPIRTTPRQRKAALLVVDMIQDYLAPGSPLEQPLARGIIPALQQRLEWARMEGIPIFYLNDFHEEDDPDLEQWPRHAVRGTPGAGVVPALAPRQGDYVIPHATYSGFYGTDLEAHLARLGVEEVILTGTGVDLCILMTAIDALMRGFSVDVPEDSVAGLTVESKHFALSRLSILTPYRGGRDR